MEKFYFCKKILGNYFIHQNNQSIINNLHFNNIINVLHYAKLENNKIIIQNNFKKNIYFLQ